MDIPICCQGDYGLDRVSAKIAQTLNPWCAFVRGGMKERKQGVGLRFSRLRKAHVRVFASPVSVEVHPDLEGCKRCTMLREMSVRIQHSSPPSTI